MSGTFFALLRQLLCCGTCTVLDGILFALQKRPLWYYIVDQGIGGNQLVLLNGGACIPELLQEKAELLRFIVHLLGE